MASTSSRTLRLLSLLQTHRFWAGPVLAGRLEVSERTLRRDVDRLRALGYPVTSTRGVEGGYQLGTGGSLPPLVVDEDEAIALVVALGGAANGSAGALAEASLSALIKVVQVLPPRLRRRAETLRAVTTDAPWGQAPEVTAEVLAALAQAIRDAERVRFAYTPAGGQAPGQDAPRHVEPHHLVTVGRRWYLVAYDLDRQDWRSFRLDRLREPLGTRSLFRPREVPGGDPAAFVRERTVRAETGEVLTFAVAAPVEEVAARLGRWATVEETGPGRCRVTAEFRDPSWAVFTIGVLEAPVTLESATPAVRDALDRWATRLAALT